MFDVTRYLYFPKKLALKDNYFMLANELKDGQKCRYYFELILRLRK